MYIGGKNRLYIYIPGLVPLLFNVNSKEATLILFWRLTDLFVHNAKSVKRLLFYEFCFG